jgi:hypothetical protein
MSWNYRVVRGAEGLGIFDVYYNESGKPIGSHISPTHVHGETIEDLKSQLALMLEALDQPVLEDHEISGG